MTKGEYRVGINFNPSASPLVDKIKNIAAVMIDLIDEIENSDPFDSAQRHEVERLKALAQIATEEAAMWAVKAATKGKRA